jgi:cold shock protein
MPTGKRVYSARRFIQPDDGSTDILVHVSALARSGMADLVKGQRVSFEVEVDQHSGKSRIANVRPAE